MVSLLQVGRPSNMPQAQQVIDEIQEEAKNYNRIFIASIHPDLTEEDIKSVFEAFGPILFCKLSQGNSLHSHKGYGFIEYATKNAMDEAISSMNLFDLGGQLLRFVCMMKLSHLMHRIFNFFRRVGRAITPPNALMGPAANSSMPTAAAGDKLDFVGPLTQFISFFLCFRRCSCRRRCNSKNSSYGRRCQ